MLTPKSNGPMQAVHNRLPDKNKLTIPKFFKLNKTKGIFNNTTRIYVTQSGLFLKKHAETEQVIPN